MPHTQNAPHTTTTWQLTTPSEAKGQRLDGFLGQALADQGISRGRIKSWIKEGRLRISGVTVSKPSTLLQGGELLELEGISADSPLAPEDGDLSILYEDEHLIILDKPHGLTVHPAPGLESGTLVHRLLHRYPEMASMDSERPGIVHRIDKDTSGLLLVARTEAARLALAQAFEDRQVDKEYLALVHGVPESLQGEIQEPIGRHPVHKTRMAVVAKGGRPAHSVWRVLHASPDGEWSLLAVRIHTGRTHQIRVHLSHLGHPIMGDGVYGLPASKHPQNCPEKSFRRLASRQMLHAWKLGMQHPMTPERLDFRRPPPADFMRLALCLHKRAQRVVVTGLPGSGKSTLARLLHEAGAPLFCADAVVADLYKPGRAGWSFLFQRYGERYLLATEDLPLDQRPVDKRALFQDMQASPSLRKEVEAALHPMVFDKLQLFWREHAAKSMAVAEIPLLFEASGDTAAAHRTAADSIVGVFCPHTTRLERLKQTRGWGEETLAAMDSWQWPQPAKINACQLIVDNSGTKQDLERRTQALLKVLRRLRASGAARFAARLRNLWGEDKT